MKKAMAGIAGLALGVALLVAASDRAVGQIDPICGSTASASSGVLLACPQGDGDAFGALGLTIHVVVKYQGAPVVGVPAADFWLVGCNDMLWLCGQSASIDADGPTDANGETTISGRLAAGGCDVGVRVVVQGVVLETPECSGPLCLDIAVRSPDVAGPGGMTAGGVVDLLDFSAFASHYSARGYDACADLAAPFGVITIADFARFANHYRHRC